MFLPIDIDKSGKKMKVSPLQKIELLAPAKNLSCGIEAINHGADAVYIGAPMFGARAAATNSIEDIEQLVVYAHFYNVKVYVTVNVILYEDELREVEKMIWDLYRIGVDALIVQDMGITQLHLPPIPLHASTQMDNRDAAKVDFLYKAGFNQVVLAREMSLEQIREIHQACPKVTLEAFVHGALCVSFSGQCYVSQSCYGRSANRGECAQFCRMPFALVDSNGETIVHDKHLLSLKDMNRLDDLSALIDAGVRSFKIEGRLKDISYVKNITATYHQRLNEVLKHKEGFERASSGDTRFFFTPQPDKSFSRGFTNYFLKGRTSDITSFDTPKSLGEEMGYVKEQKANFVVVAGLKPFHNGDGVCYLDENGKLKGFRVNKVEGNKLYPAERLPKIPRHTIFYRNADKEFEQEMNRKSAERKIGIKWKMYEFEKGFVLDVTDEDGNYISLTIEADKSEKARTPQLQNIKNNLSKTGNTPYMVRNESDIMVEFMEDWFIPASLLSEWRRVALEKLSVARRSTYKQGKVEHKPTHHDFPLHQLTYLGNVSNSLARSFYASHGVQSIDSAYENKEVPQAVLMFCKHCLRYSMGWCPTYQKKKSPYREPYYLVGKDGKKFRLEFDCKNCQMKVHAPE